MVFSKPQLITWFYCLKFFQHFPSSKMVFCCPSNTSHHLNCCPVFHFTRSIFICNINFGSLFIGTGTLRRTRPHLSFLFSAYVLVACLTPISIWDCSASLRYKGSYFLPSAYFSCITFATSTHLLNHRKFWNMLSFSCLQAFPYAILDAWSAYSTYVFRLIQMSHTWQGFLWPPQMELATLAFGSSVYCSFIHLFIHPLYNVLHT